MGLTPTAARRVGSWGGGALLLSAGALLSVGAATGTLVRPLADEWCVAGSARDVGFGSMVAAFYAHSNGRAANGAIDAIVYSHGMTGAQLLPALLAVLLSVGTFQLLRLLLQLGSWKVPWTVLLGASCGVVSLLLLAGGASYQVFFWAPGSVTHTLPALLGLWSVVVALLARRRNVRVRRTALVVAVLVGFVIGTLNEPFVVVSGVLAVAAALLLVPRARARGDWFDVTWCVAWLVGVLAGFVLLLTSPGLAHRETTIDQAPLLSVGGVLDALRQWASMLGSVAHQPAYLGAVAFGMLVGLTAAGTKPADGERIAPSARRTLITWVVLPVGLLALMSFGVIAGLRLGYGRSGWTYERAWTNFLYPALLLLMLYGFVAGRYLASRETASLEGLRALSALLSVAAIASLAPGLASLRTQMQQRAAEWDRQNASIVREVKAGATQVSYTPMRIGHLLEPFSYPPGEDWQERCVAKYYRVSDIVPSAAWLRSPASIAYRAEYDVAP